MTPLLQMILRCAKDWAWSLLRIYQKGTGASEWLSSSYSPVEVRRAQYEWSVQEKAWREIFLIIVFFLGFGANEVDILENIIDERRRIFTIAQGMKRRPHLPDVGIGIERGKDGCEGDRYIEQEEGSGIVWFGRI